MLRVEWRNLTSRFALLSKQRNESNSFYEWKWNPQPSHLQADVVPLEHDVTEIGEQNGSFFFLFYSK